MPLDLAPETPAEPATAAAVAAAAAAATLPASPPTFPDLTRFIMQYKFAVDEVRTKLSILQQEFEHLHKYNPIEHISSRIKSPESILEKAQRRGLDRSLEGIRAGITDIAGIRVTCSFVPDTYRMLDTLVQQRDITVREIKDYIAEPKANGYKSLHAIVDVPVFLSDGPVEVTVELQFRTIAMDFWASLEHKIHYKYRGEVPEGLAEELREAADTAGALDAKMERLHAEVMELRQGAAGEEDARIPRLAMLRQLYLED